MATHILDCAQVGHKGVFADAESLRIVTRRVGRDVDEKLLEERDLEYLVKGNQAEARDGLI